MLIFVAELGDKTQFMTLALSSRYPAATVLSGVTLGTVFVSILLVAMGEMLGSVLPQAPINILAGIIFIIFALLALKQNSKEENAADAEASKIKNHPRHLLLTIAMTFFVAELADKTMLATIAIASRDKNYLAVWLGSSLGLIASNSLAIIVGKTLSQKLTGKVMHITTAIIFLCAGALAIWSGITTH